MISVQQQDFNIGDEYHALIQDAYSEGAVVTFVGLVRDINQGNSVKGLTLEHYPGMTEKSLKSIVQQAKQRWPLGKVRVIHRVGKLKLSDQIVFVGVTSRHRESAFLACQFIMDYLKNQAPFWKKESTEKGESWVEFNDKDQKAMQRWQK
ncbi:molybdopterin synthase catalytic subunit MoaE [Thalassotalea profundi]|uniref:Molybdopterin synthase catalytic subunit n=1 Tax=Thalassotalea profundi TaxID=2036687 RepID=A0ABQ3IYC8_9GAMM|nr:molybdopterin synthase catalytic subunit MoaE [Thalassotalea profundi]GHE98443.1 molybdopterin guanine dinucleotide biosynthesis protein MoaE [Thalassotalea profundi]